ncbi:hypothetical protein Cgig2_023348 [Carnegiea gigantea]|uniref:Uncharacterized protein n=1 Tax=Carnegiea gigantea TaxID=171969 RepID=A0A9Q1JL66_9CARY|nr:hypothetical protein Cgig2_023348 [Carnegiea gigantea]
MARRSTSFWLMEVVCFLSFLISSLLFSCALSSTPQFDAIYLFGDSIADTGNDIRETPSGGHSGCGRPFYGQTFFHHPTGRCSDGRRFVHCSSLIKTSTEHVQEVIGLGAKRIIVPGNFPVGCMTIYLARFGTKDPTMYDELHCLKSWNEFAAFHNDQLQTAIKNLQKEHPDVAMVYADYFNAMRSILRDASSQEPEKHVSWDGIHLTEHAYQLMANSLLKSILPTTAQVN